MRKESYWFLYIIIMFTWGGKVWCACICLSKRYCTANVSVHVGTGHRYGRAGRTCRCPVINAPHVQRATPAAWRERTCAAPSASDRSAPAPPPHDRHIHTLFSPLWATAKCTWNYFYYMNYMLSVTELTICKMSLPSIVHHYKYSNLNYV